MYTHCACLPIKCDLFLVNAIVTKSYAVNLPRFYSRIIKFNRTCAYEHLSRSSITKRLMVGKVSRRTRSKLASLQRLATINSTRAMRTIPSNALDALLHPAAIETRLEATAMRPAVRLSLNSLWHAVAAALVEGHTNNR